MRSLSGGANTALRVSCVTKAPGEDQGHTSCPDEEEASVPPLFKLGHDTINDVWLWSKDVYGVHVSYGLPALLQALDV